ncbi:Hypothetical predicted protein, partial [Marmota monax]
VAGIKGIFLANKKVDDQVKTYITYNKGRDWRLLQAPDVDLRGSPVHCLLVSHPWAGQFPVEPVSRAFFHEGVLGAWLVLSICVLQLSGIVPLSSDGHTTWVEASVELYILLLRIHVCSSS